MIVTQSNWRAWVQGLRALTRGEGFFRPSSEDESPELNPIASDLIADLLTDHCARGDERVAWSRETVRGILHRDVRG